MGYQWRRFERRNIKRRIRHRMESLGIHDLRKYEQLVKSNPEERDALDSCLRLTITRFFRNSWLWEELVSLILKIEECLDAKEYLSIWSAGCAGGEEPYSIAMLLDDLGRSGNLSRPWNILGTDTDEASLLRTKGGGYKWGSVREIPEHLLDRWFEEKDGLWYLNEDIRKRVKISRHDLLTMPAPGRFHIVFLRNSTLTYNTDEIQQKVLYRIQECLLYPGYLITGRTETLPEGAGFNEISKCIYRKAEEGREKEE